MPQGSPGLGKLATKLVRFGLVGALSSLIYALATSIYISQAQLDSRSASIAGYLTAIPFSFLAQRYYTFAASGPILGELGRFWIVHTVGIAVSWLAMALTTETLGLHYAVGIGATMVLVPLISFFVLDRWVFSARSGRG